MRVIRLTARANRDGQLRLEVPDADADTENEVVLTAKPTPDELGWPPGYFEATFGWITDETFVRQPQPPITSLEPLDAP